MTILLPTLAVAFAAFCVWLTVRIVNRKERWAKRTAIAMAILCVLYVLSSGPLRRFVDHRIARAPGGAAIFIWKKEQTWWPSAFAPLVWASKYWWGEPLNWYWSIFPINPTIEEA